MLIVLWFVVASCTVVSRPDSKMRSSQWSIEVDTTFLFPLPCSYVGSEPGAARVGSRKRARPVVVPEPGQLSDGRGTIPLERSLIVSIDSSVDDA